MRKGVVVVFLFVVAMYFVGSATEIVVTSTADSGAGTLRWALRTAQSGDTITFDTKVFPPDDPATIYPKSELPPIERPLGRLTIDASNAGVIIDGRNVPRDWNNGLQIYADANKVMGLQIVNFAGSGIAICSANYNTIGGNRGTGDGPIGQGNIVSRNAIGIDLCNSGVGNVIVGNIIGTDATETRDWGNTQSGIWIEDGVSKTTIGPDNVIAYNIIGIEVSGPRACCNTITKNNIYGNQVFPIYLRDGGNGELQPPLVTSFTVEEGILSGRTCPSCQVEIFSTVATDGEQYEGQVAADSSGVFIFEKGDAFAGPYVTAVTTDESGSTSSFSSPAKIVTMQSNNNLFSALIQPKPSNRLEDNLIGGHYHGLWEAPDLEAFAEQSIDLGLKHFRVSINCMDSDKVRWDKPEFEIDPTHVAFINTLVENGISATLVLSFWDKARRAAGGEIPSPRFQTEEDIAHYLDYVRFVVEHFKDRVRYYELWNEPTIRDTIQWVKLPDYIKLVKRAVPAIREIYPEAKVVGGSASYLAHDRNWEFMYGLVISDVMPMIDVISCHPMYSTTPEFEEDREYYYNYSRLMQQLMTQASLHGFQGEFRADELVWWTPEIFASDQLWPHPSSEIRSAKHYGRGIIVNLGMGISVSEHGIDPWLWPPQPHIFDIVQNLCTVMAGHEVMRIPVSIDIDYTPTAQYSFQFQNGDRMLAVWTDGIPQDDDPGVPATITFPGLLVEEIVGVDVLHGFEQELIFEVVDENTVVRDLLVKDYPILLRLSGVTESENYQELLQRQADRDGDGVPDEEDYCPDYPGDPATNGC